MTGASEIRELLQGLRQYILIGREWGLEPPSLSRAALDYLEGTAQERPPATLEELRALIGDCRRCKLWADRTQIVFGEGSSSARLVFVGGAPGKEQDTGGRSFAGEDGELLTKIIEGGMKMKTDEVYVCSVVKCRPPEDREPESEEIEACVPFLREQLRIIKPQVICGLGNVAVSTLTGKRCEISQERGRWASWSDIPLMPTLHPAHVLGNPDEVLHLKRLVWEDVKEILRKMGRR